MDSFREIYWLKCKEKAMYTGVYISTQSHDFDMNITKLLSKCPGIESCYPCGKPDPSIKITGWTGIHFDSSKMEIQIEIYEDYDTATPKILLKESFPVTYDDFEA